MVVRGGLTPKGRAALFRACDADGESSGAARAPQRGLRVSRRCGSGVSAEVSLASLGER